jgi:hypothetical protein
MLSLAIPNAHSLLGSCEDRNAVREIYRSAKAHNSIVRHENFRSDLTRLLKVELMSRVIDLDEAIRFVETQKPMNSSKRSLGREKFHGLESGLRELLREREWFLCEEFSYAFDQAEAAA